MLLLVNNILNIYSLICSIYIYSFLHKVRSRRNNVNVLTLLKTLILQFLSQR